MISYNLCSQWNGLFIDSCNMQQGIMTCDIQPEVLKFINIELQQNIIERLCRAFLKVPFEYSTALRTLISNLLI